MAAPSRVPVGLLLTLCSLLVLAGCDGPQSVLAPSSETARELVRFWWIMAAGAVVIYVLVAGFALYAARARPLRRPDFTGQIIILAGGAALPIVVLSGLLTYSFVLGRDLTRHLGEDVLRIEVVGRQWWWEVRYLPPGRDQPVIGANEVRLPVGQPVEVLLRSTDVIHSFWVPKLAGKTDMIPGRVNRMVLEAEEAGVFRGQCAEYCGGPHALMAFYTVAMPADEFDTWLEDVAGPAEPPADPFAARGRALFIDSGCGACHAIRGTPAEGRFGPDLTDVGGRVSLAAGILPNNVGTIAGWIAGAQDIKPGNKMPSFNTFTGEELRALATYLAGLR